MFNPRKRWDSSWGVCVLFHIVVFLFAMASCFDPCPESLRDSTAARPPNIPDSEVEMAFHQANDIVRHRRVKEKRLIREGKVVDIHSKSEDSTHQQSWSLPLAREKELKQMVFEEATNILAVKFKLTAEQVSCGLPNLQFTEPALMAQEKCFSGEPIVCDHRAKYRTADGTCNNLDNPTWGRAFSCFRRLLAPVYTVNSGMRKSVRCGPLPHPRNLSLNVHSNTNRRTNNVNHLYVFFGQLLDHDITLTSQSSSEKNEPIQCCTQSSDNHPQCAAIDIRNDDPFYSQHNKTCLNFVRSALCPYCTLGARTQMNTVTAFIDGSFVYGNSENETNSLRAFRGTGELLVQKSNVGDLLPASFDPKNDRCSVPERNQTCFVAGDRRVNQTPLLASLHTLCLREHNRIARKLKSLNPRWNESTLFQVARKIFGAEMQSITYREYLPITVGNDVMSTIGQYYEESTYNKNMNPALLTEFSTAAFRFGHSLLNPMISEDPRKPNHTGHLLRDVFSYPFDLHTGEMDPLLKGATRSPAQCFNRHMIPDVTNFLYRVGSNPTGLDLAAFNIQRGRDHGLPGYVACVTFCFPHLPVKSFDDLVEYHLMYPENMELMRSNYESVEDIDMFTGMTCEIHLPEAILGPTGACIVGKQFQRLKYGDRFFYQHSDQSVSFTAAQRNQLGHVSLSRMICDNTNISEIQYKAMQYPSNSNPIVSCRNLGGMDLSAWKE